MFWSICSLTRLTRWPTRDFAERADRIRRIAQGGLLLALSTAPVPAQQKVSVPTGPPGDAPGVRFRDSRYGVRFEVPPGWNFTRKDREVSTFRLDARTAPPASEVRGVASIGFNPFPRSVLSGAVVYFSVAKHSTDQTCAAEATVPAFPASAPELGDAKRLDWRHESTKALGTSSAQTTESIGGMPFAHGHDEHGGICVEGRDEVYTAYRKGSCYRFDLTLNTFCSVSSGAAELSSEQMHSLEAQMTGILSTVALDWEKSGPQPVPVPESVPKNSPRRQIPAAPAGQKPSVGVGE